MENRWVLCITDEQFEWDDEKLDQFVALEIEKIEDAIWREWNRRQGFDS